MAPRHHLRLLVLLIAAACTVLPSLVATTSSSSGSTVVDDQGLLMLDRFHRWIAAHGRTYPSATEKQRRFEVYRHNVDFIDASNRDAETLGYELGENEFTDLTNEEFVARYTNGAAYRHDEYNGSVITTLAGDVTEGRISAGELEDPPKHWDWREHGVVTPAKLQGACACCWAFAAAATVESLNKIKGGELVDLSVQELVDCSRWPFESPCTSGDADTALNWIKSHGGLLTEADYPYVAKRGQCMAGVKDGARRVGKITRVQSVPRGERALALAVLKNPVAVSIDATGLSKQSYKSGIYTGPCSTSQNHAVVVVGYSVDAAGVEYWIAKNSWGQGWGQNGFVYMRKGADGADGLCGIADEWNVYPVI